MSKVVKSVGRAISSVVSGVVSAVKSVASGIGDLAKSIGSSKLGKAILIAGAIYFGGAALMGGFGSSAAGGSFLSGMGTGVSSAASSLSSAWGSVMAGEASTAASTVGNAWGTAGAAGTAAGTEAAAAAAAAQAAGTGAMTVAPTAAPTAAAGGGATPWVQSPTGLNVLASETAGATAPAATGFASLSPMAQYGVVTGGTQLVGGLIQGAGQQQAMKSQQEYAERMAQEARNRYNANVGASLFSGTEPGAPGPGMPPAQPWDALSAAREINARYAATRPGLIGSNIPGYPSYA